MRVRAPSRMLNCGASMPSLTSRRDTSRPSSTSRLREFTTAARDVFAPADRLSTTVVVTPSLTRDAARVSPLGPAPITSTSVSYVLFTLHRLHLCQRLLAQLC